MGSSFPPNPLQPAAKPSGLLIVLEGIDGTGKSTQSRRLGEWFTSQGREVVLSREPTAGPWGKKLRETAATGRLSSNNPNLQNIPVRSEAGRKIRKAFVSRRVGVSPTSFHAEGACR